MRIISGAHRGRKLNAPAGDGTRPTTDRVRESLMSAIASLRGGFEDARVLDAFAGSGALAFEALSRGASHACLVEKNRLAVGIVSDNAHMLGYDSTQAHILRADILKHGVPHYAHLRGPFDLIFFDPPYALGVAEVFGLLERLDNDDVVAQDAIVSYEHDASVDQTVEDAAAAAGWEINSRRHFGDTTVDLMERLCTTIS